MANAYSSISTRKTAQTEPTIGKNEVKNNAGGFVFKLSPLAVLQRFLILGSAGGTFYVGEKELTKKNAENILTIFANRESGLKAVEMIAEISDSGRAAKNDPALFALAIASASTCAEVRQAALAALPRVARIPTHLFHFVAFMEQFRGWGRAAKRAIGAWYNTRDVDNLAYVMTKYQQRDGWSNADLLRLSHPKTDDAKRNALYKWTVDAEIGENTPKIISAIERVKELSTHAKIAGANLEQIEEVISNFNLSREHLPTELLALPGVWEAMLPKMGLEQMMRNLGNMTRIGLIKPLSDAERQVCDKLRDGEAIRCSRLHPYAILVAIKVYNSGGGYLSDKTWKPSAAVVEALNEAFYASFKYLEPTGKSYLLGVDVSGSMSAAMIGSRVDGRDRMVPGAISAAEGAAALAMAIAKTEKNYYIHGFTSGSNRYGRHGWDAPMDGFIDLGIRASDSLQEALKKTRAHNFGATDCALPVLYALKEGIKVDCFIILTDNETWTGSVKPFQALTEYRQKVNPEARMVVVGMTATDFTIADPSDTGSLDVVGFDASVPSLISEFVIGRI